MKFPYPTEWPPFFTASIENRLPLLDTDKYKNIITHYLHFIMEHKRIELNAFVVMNNHIHLIWQPLPGHSLFSIQLPFMKFTAQQIKFALKDGNNQLLEKYRVNKKDRQFQIWKRNLLSVALSVQNIFLQELEYIHHNPVKAVLSSSASVRVSTNRISNHLIVS